MVANALRGNGGADLFEIRNDGVSGVDTIADFSHADVLAVTKAISDANNDGIITWNTRGRLTLDASDGDQVALTGLAGSKGLRFLGTADGLSYYGDATTRPVARSGQKIYESRIGDDSYDGSSKTTTTDVFFFDTANAAPGQGADRISLTARDLLVTTTALVDGNGDGIISLGGLLDLSGNGGTVALHNGTKAIGSIEYDGSMTHDGVTYYVYSNVGSSVGVSDLHF